MRVPEVFTTATPHLFEVGQKLFYTTIAPGPPLWSYGWPWQDGDRAIFQRVYEILGWWLPLRSYARDMVVTGIPTVTTLEIK